MRQVHVQVAAGNGARVLDIAQAHGVSVMHAYEARGVDGEAVAVAVLHVPNRSVGPLVDALESLPDLHFALVPQGVIALKPPATEVAGEVQDVSSRSPIEIFLAGLQSVGSWRSFLAYAAAAGAVVWLGLITNAVYLLVAAMLIAPFAGPAMNAAIATARGDLKLLGRALLRYVSSLTVTSVVAGLLTWLFGQDVVTAQMAATANISTAAVVLPLAAGAAGALQLVQGERSSLVSGAAIGMLVAASLAPPAGLLGMAAALADWELIPSALFLLALQLVGINLAGACIFRLAGLGPRGVRYSRGRAGVAWGSAAASAAALAALLGWQLGSAAPTLERSTLEQRARHAVHRAMEGVPGAQLAAVEASFTRPDIHGQNTLLVQLFVQRAAAAASEEDLRRQIAARVQRAIVGEWPMVTPLVDVTLLDPP